MHRRRVFFKDIPVPAGDNIGLNCDDGDIDFPSFLGHIQEGAAFTAFDHNAINFHGILIFYVRFVLARPSRTSVCSDNLVSFFF